MTSADRPSGPGKPLQERREAATEQEELDELAAEQAGEPVDAPAEEAAAAARHAERAAHTPSDAGGSGGSRETGA